MWWSIATVTTVGYGDVYPVTAEGKVIASMLMIMGIMVLGLFISTLGTSLIETRLAKTKKNQNMINLRGDDNSDGKQKDGNSSNNTMVKQSRKRTKLLIKNKIDFLETLREDEVDMLIGLIKTIYYKKSRL